LSDPGQTIIIIVALAVLLLIAYGMAFWAERASRDRSAMVGLYLVFGFPGFLLALLGLARIIGRDSSGPMWLATGLGLALPLLLPVRKQLSRVMPFDPASSIDMVGLSAILATIGFLGGQYLSDPDPTDPGSVGIAELTSQFVAFVLIAYVIVGTRIWRTLPEATRRLGLTLPTRRQIGVGVVATLVGFAVMIVAGVATTVFQPDFNQEIEQATEGITESVSNPLGAVFFGLGAGMSEELLLRGAIQPRFGIILTSVLFALLHNQYGVSFILAGVFAMGVVLGLERKYFGTTAAVITHALFNATAVLLSS